MRPAGLLCALLLPSRYLGLVLAWALFAYFLATEPALRLPLAAYLAFILSPAGRRAVGRCRWPPLLRRYPLYTCFPLYAPAQLIKTADLGPGRKYLLATHPHGVLGNSSLLALGTEGLGWGRLFPGVRLSYGILDFILLTPFVREICLLHGWLGVSKHMLLDRLAAGPGAVAIVVGGAAEAVLAEPGTLDLVLLKRKGFVRVALQAGADLVPVICFGENEQYHRVPVRPGSWLDRLQTATKQHFGFTLPLAYGRGILGLRFGPWPEPVPLHIVVGAPMSLPAFVGDLRSEEGRSVVDECHAMYLRALQALYDAHKERCAPARKRDMRFVA